MLLCCLAVVCFLDVSAQEKIQVTGTVKDADGAPVVAATIKEKGTTNQVSSDLKGAFRISIQPGATLIISSVGFETREIVPDNNGVADVQLAVSTTELSTVVVTALGIKREKNHSAMLYRK